MGIPTHNKGHTLDIIITTTEHYLSEPPNTIAGPYISDDRLIILETSETKLDAKVKRHKIRKINVNTIHEFCKKFNNDQIMQATTLEEVVSNMNGEMLQTLDLVAPTKVVKAKKRKPKPWYDKELKEQWKILKNRECKWFKYREDSHCQACKHERNRYINMLKLKKTHSLHQSVKQNSTDSKKLFKLINELTGNKDHNPLPAAKLNKVLAEEFAEFFLNKIEKIREQFESSPT